METQEQSLLLKNAWNGEPSAVFSTKTLVSARLYLLLEIQVNQVAQGNSF